MRDIELAGVDVPAGSCVVAHVGSANRDEHAMGATRRIRPLPRAEPAHLVRAPGPTCASACTSARMEMRSARSTLLLDRLPDMRLDPAGRGRPHPRRGLPLAPGCRCSSSHPLRTWCATCRPGNRLTPGFQGGGRSGRRCRRAACCGDLVAERGGEAAALLDGAGEVAVPVRVVAGVRARRRAEVLTQVSSSGSSASKEKKIWSRSSNSRGSLVMVGTSSPRFSRCSCMRCTK